MKKIIVFLIIGIMLCSPAFAALSSYRIFPLNLPGSARVMGMGFAATGIRDLGNYNPGFLPWSKGTTAFIKSMQSKNSNETNINFMASFPSGTGATSSIAVLLTDQLGKLPSRGSSYYSKSTVVVLSYGTRLQFKHDFNEALDIQDWSAGINLKALLSQDFNDDQTGYLSGSGWDIDFGVAYMLSPFANFGLCAKNILPANTLGGGVLNWNDKNNEGFPASINLGLGILLAGKGNALIKHQDNTLLLDFDLEYGNQDKLLLLKSGAEYCLNDKYYFRLGVSQRPSTKGTDMGTNFGFGLKEIDEWQIDTTVTNDIWLGGSAFIISGSYFPANQFFIDKPIEHISISKEASTTYHPGIEVSGKVKPDIKEVTINNKPIKIDNDFTFKDMVTLAPGDNLIEVKSKYENESSFESYSVERKLPPKEPVKEISITDFMATTEAIVELFGRAEPEIPVKINRQEVPVDKEGKFQSKIKLEPGYNKVVVEGQYGEKTVKKTYTIEGQFKKKEAEERTGTDKKLIIPAKPIGPKFIPEPTRIRIIGQSTYEVSQASPMLKVVTEDDYGVRMPVLQDTKILLRSSSLTGVFSSSEADGPWNATFVIIPAGSSEAHYYYMDTNPGNPTLQAYNPTHDWKDSYYGEYILPLPARIEGPLSEEIKEEHLAKTKRLEEAGVDIGPYPAELKAPEKFPSEAPVTTISAPSVTTPTVRITTTTTTTTTTTSTTSTTFTTTSTVKTTTTPTTSTTLMPVEESKITLEEKEEPQEGPKGMSEEYLAKTKRLEEAGVDIPLYPTELEEPGETAVKERPAEEALSPYKYEQPAFKKAIIPEKTKMIRKQREIVPAKSAAIQKPLEEEKVKLSAEEHAKIVFQQKQYKELPVYPIKSPLDEANKFKEMQKILKQKTGLTILRIAKIKLPPGYFLVYVVTNDRYLALKNLRNGLVRVDYYNSSRSTWETLATIRLEEIANLI